MLLNGIPIQFGAIHEVIHFQDDEMQQGLHRRPLGGGQLSATVRPETTRGPAPQRREANQRALLVPRDLQLQDQQSLSQDYPKPELLRSKVPSSSRSNQCLPKTWIASSDHQKFVFLLNCYLFCSTVLLPMLGMFALTFPSLTWSWSRNYYSGNSMMHYFLNNGLPGVVHATGTN